ncbi:MAG: ATP-binding protein [Brevinematales bacterium]|nr:ATP-binding protein [Brevinematales bacterium]
MKKFNIQIKPVEEDLIDTSNVWLSFSEAKRGFNFTTFSNNSEFLLISSKEVININSNKTNLFEDFKKNIELPNIIYINSLKKTINYSVKSSPFILLFQRNKNNVIKLTGTGEITYSEEDILIGFDSDFNINQEEKLFEYIFNSQSIANLFLREMLDYLVSNQKSTRPLFVINFTEHTVFKFKMQSNLKTLSLTIDMLKNKVVKYNTEKLWQFETVIHEALMNAITHGNELESKKEVKIFYEYGKRGIRIIIKDMGKGFDVNNLSVPIGEEALDIISGRGIYLMSKLSDVLFYSPEGNETLIFFNF